MSIDWLVEKLSLYQALKVDGFALTVRTPGTIGTFSETTLEYTGSTLPVDVTTYGVIKNYSANEIDGIRIQQRDLKLIISAYGLSSDLTTTNQIILNSVAHNIVSVKKFVPANLVFGYELQLRESD